MKLNFRQFLKEVSFAHARRIMVGDMPQVDSIGIVTAQNPMGMDFTDTQLGRSQNNNLNKMLVKDLRELGLGPIKIKGKYAGASEKSFVIPNVSREELVELARKYNQEAVIWGEKKTNKYGHPYIHYQWIENGETTQTRDISVSSGDVNQRDDFYSQVRSGKFVIPFFDDPYADHEHGEKYGTLKPPGKTVQIPGVDQDAYRKAEWKIPFVDSDEVLEVIY